MERIHSDASERDEQQTSSPSGDDANDYDARKFTRNDTAFRGAMDTPSRLHPGASRGFSWLGSTRRKSTTGSNTNVSDENTIEGFLRRWVEEPKDVDEEDEAAQEEPSTSSHPHESPKPFVRSPLPMASLEEPTTEAPKNLEGQSDAIATIETTKVNWDSAVRKLGLRKPRSVPDLRRTQHDPDAAEGVETNETEARMSAFRPVAARLASKRWNLIRNRFAREPVEQAGHVASASDVNITDELLSGGLAALMVQLHFERDEQNKKRVPVLLHHLRIRVSDSARPMSDTHTLFRIECEYANGAARWVIYRQLRDFVRLHGKFRIAKATSRSDLELPEFPLNSLPLPKFKFIKGSEEERKKQTDSRIRYARLQRLLIENYLLALIKSVMFRPEGNRLARFLEISALSVAVAEKGGVQGKSGLLKIIGGESGKKNANSGLGMLLLGAGAKSKWWILRESYLVAVTDPGDTEVWDVFLFDGDFKLERPTRYYRKLDPSRLIPDGSEGSDSGSTSEGHGAQRHLPDPEANEEHRHSVRSWFNMSQRAKKKKEEKEGIDDDEMIPNGKLEVEDDPLSGQQDSKDVSQHTFHISNSQRRLKLVAKNERQLRQWVRSVEQMARGSHWIGENRFDSFAPIRLNVAAQWLVDGRDYFWNLSKAILLAKDRIYIHDWWLSPELEMRRPNRSQFRIDRLLRRKAEEGVKIFVIVYKEVSNQTTPTDSNYTKRKLMSLHPNILVQRSPSHFATGTFFWAHHEKMCVIDETIAFMGGLDICFGRWDTPQHALVDDPDNMEDRIWQGKDYANERVLEFHTLSKPFDDMYDRVKVPRMPWHDVAMQMVGQPARDLCRHFCQRWNHLLRIKSHSRVMPFLLPPPDFTSQYLKDNNLIGSCEVQVCRSAGSWSMGFLNRTEHSIQNAYLKAIQMSEHFVYIENQFFITSTTVNDIKIENRVGDALVDRIKKAHRKGQAWRACIVIPLLPGFTFPVDHSDASAVRIIMECQNRTICRGPDSIFGRLRREGIDPNDYITFFGLRQWGKLRGGALTTEELYIHGKTMTVDDRLTIIGSANINERSQRGDRDSELASIIRDTDMMESSMGGKPYKVGRFNHTLRVRLMREHLGIDVDDLAAKELTKTPSDTTIPNPPAHSESDTSTDDETMKSNEHGGETAQPAINEDDGAKPTSTPPPHDYAETSSYWNLESKRPVFDQDSFKDPLQSSFFKDIWLAAASYNTEVYRKVFHCTPDDMVSTWNHYKEFVLHQERLQRPVKGSSGQSHEAAGRVPEPMVGEHGISRSDTRTSKIDEKVEERQDQQRAVSPEPEGLSPRTRSNSMKRDKSGRSGRKRPTPLDQPLEQWEVDEMETLLKTLCGHLVMYSTRFLEGEDISNNFLYNTDRLLPLPIYD